MALGDLTSNRRRPADAADATEYPTDLPGILSAGTPPPTLNRPMDRQIVGAGGPQVFVPSKDGEIIPSEFLPEGTTFERPQRQAGDVITPPIFKEMQHRNMDRYDLLGVNPLGKTTPPPPPIDIRTGKPSKAFSELPAGMTFEPANSFRSSIDATTKRVGDLGGRDPLEVLSTLVPKAQLADALQSASTAAPVAQWAGAYERVLRTGGGPQALASLNIATRNLGNTLGTPLDMRDLFNGKSVE